MFLNAINDIKSGNIQLVGDGSTTMQQRLGLEPLSLNKYVQSNLIFDFQYLQN